MTSINGVSPLQFSMPASSIAKSGSPDEPGMQFANVLGSKIDQLNTQQLKTEQLQSDYIKDPTSVDLSTVMMELQKTSLEFQTTVAVRNKIVDAYKDIMNMQI